VIEFCGTDECGIGRLNPYYAFRPNSKISKKIFSKCVPGDDCEVTGVVDDTDFFVSVSRVRLIDIDIEPSAAVKKDAACWLY